ncbi:hypothetical protein SEMRO_2601_G332370.1 [Seminavis robusta]|uniref:Uncharacterized protein n=1 Tax=Seminavis robusta TaxID=568900 RepID=A0A9N8EZI7_9STRA|nr:hypothetical protein SEMRO_2601_G332370.1 [Seminavis robusta]|eukprot:Sro2601_g332370.1 n/a (106) ;mRNA; f:11376-11693
MVDFLAAFPLPQHAQQQETEQPEQEDTVGMAAATNNNDAYLEPIPLNDTGGNNDKVLGLMADAEDELFMDLRDDKRNSAIVKENNALKHFDCFSKLRADKAALLS